MNPQQPTLFDIDKERRTRRPYKRVRRSNSDLSQHLRFLRTYRMIADANGGKVKIKELQDKFHIGHFPRKALPVDLLTIDEGIITEAYAAKWRVRLNDYYQNCGRRPRTNTNTLQAEVEVIQPTEQVSIGAIYASIKRLTDDFIADMATEINKLKSFNNF